jgi:hypothetical protein
VLGVLPSVVAAFTKAEIVAGTKPDAVSTVYFARELTEFLVGTERLEACIRGEDLLSNMLMTEDIMVLIGEAGLLPQGQGPAGFAQRRRGTRPNCAPLATAAAVALRTQGAV